MGQRTEVERVLVKLESASARHVWPDGKRELWTDSFGLALFVSLFRATGNAEHLERAEKLVRDVDRSLGVLVGLRAGDDEKRDSQDYRALCLWIYALMRLGEERGEYRLAALRLAHSVHPHFVLPGVGVQWRMKADLSEPYLGFGIDSLDAVLGLTIYRLLDETDLQREITDLRRLVDKIYPSLVVTEDSGAGLLLWLSHFTPTEPWSKALRARSIYVLDTLWIENKGRFCRRVAQRESHSVAANAIIAIALRAVDRSPERLTRLLADDPEADTTAAGAHDAGGTRVVFECSALLPDALLTGRGDFMSAPAGSW